MKMLKNGFLIIILTVIFFTIITPLGLIRRLFIPNEVKSKDTFLLTSDSSTLNNMEKLF